MHSIAPVTEYKPSPNARLQSLWDRYRQERASCDHCDCDCLGIAVSMIPSVYRLHCVACGFRTPWFEAIPGEAVEVLPSLDEIAHGIC